MCCSRERFALANFESRIFSSAVEFDILLEHTL
jgi:hypothetical protein